MSKLFESHIGKKFIAVATYGFVYQGIVEYEDEDYIVLRDAVNVRQWGTEKGLGQLALTGPTKSSELDPCGTVEICKPALIHLIPSV